MRAVSVISKSWIELVFENRNQTYGAYELRKNSNQYTVRAFFLALAFLGAGISALVYASQSSKSTVPTTVEDPIFGTTVTVTKVVYDTPKPKPVLNTKKITTPEAQGNLGFVTVTTSSAASDVAASTVSTTASATGETNLSGSINGTETGAVSVTSSTSATTGTEISTSPETLSTALVDKMPEYPGGLQAFYKYVVQNFERPEMESGETLQVIVSFIVETDGSLSNIKVLRDAGNGTAAAAVKVLKGLKTKWKPGIKSGKAVRTVYNLPITLKSK
jgi:protein TonB